MRQSLILFGVCVLVLTGAWLASRALSDAPAPGVPSQPPAVAPPPALPPKMAVVQRGDVIAMQAGAGTGKSLADPHVLEDVRGAAPSADSAKPPPTTTDAPADEEPNPFLGESRELDYADKLMWEERGDGGIERLKSAREVYQRCVESVGLQRCKDGLAAVDAKLSPPKPTVRAPQPSLGTELGPEKTLPRPARP